MIISRRVTSPSTAWNSFDFLSILSRQPSLQVLHLSISDGKSIFKNVTRDEVDEMIPVVYLKELLLEIPSPDILHVLSSLMVGSSTRLSLKDTSTSPSIQEILPLDPRCLPCITSAKKFIIDRKGRKIEIRCPSKSPNDGLDKTSNESPLLTYSTASSTLCSQSLP